MGVCLSFRRWARAAPRSAVAELGVVRRCYPSRAMKPSSSRVSREAGVMPRSAPLARAALGGAFGGAVGKAVRRRNALQAGGLGLRATRRADAMSAVPHTSGPTPRITSTPNHALQRTAPRVTVAAIHVRSRLLRAGRWLTSVASFFAPPSQLPRRAPQSLSLGSLGFAELIRKTKA